MRLPALRLIIVTLCAGGAAWAGSRAGWMPQQVVMAGIVALAASLWLTEAIPAFATALVVIAAEVVLLTGPAFPVRPALETPIPLSSLLGAIADPVMLLFFSGLVLAKAAEKERVDVVIGGWLLRPFAGSPSRLLAGVIVVTALFSMWMSNTATTAFMLTLLGPILAQIPPGEVWRKALVLAVPFTASIGGMTTPISTPPNAIAMGYLERVGQPLDFVGWMRYGVPLAAVMLVILAFVLLRMFPPPPSGAIALAPSGRLSGRGIVTVAAFGITVLLWLTEAWHGVPAAVAALLPVVALLVTGVVGRKEINGLDWDVLILIAGGLALGWGIAATGLGDRIAGWLPAASAGSVWMLVAVATLTLVLGTFLSNTAVANLLLPVAVVGALPADQLPLALTVAFTASLTMALPVSGPPNAMAYARGELRARDMIVPGATLGVIGTALVVAMVLLFT